jgi:hypothetical protein
MENVDSVIFTKTFMVSLQEDGFFDENENPFMDFDLLYEEILKHSSNNLLEYNKPEITPEQFIECISAVRIRLIKETFDEMVTNGLIEPTGLDDKGDFLYSVNEDVIDDLEKN